MRYWSTTHKQWQTLIVDSHAATALRPNRPRPDFAPDEMQEGKVLYFEQADNLSGAANYRMHIAEVSADRLVFDIENVSVMRYLFLTLFSPGEMQSIYFLDRESDDVWRYYGIAASDETPAGWPRAGTCGFFDQPRRCVLSLPGRDSHRPGASGGAMNFSARSLRGCSRLGRLPWRRGAVRLLVGTAIVAATLAAGAIHYIYFDRANLPDLEAFSRFELPTIGHVYDVNGRPFIEMASEYREITHLRGGPAHCPRRPPGRGGQELLLAITESTTPASPA